MDRIPKVLFLARGTASRAEMAEGFLREIADGQWAAASAGTEASSVNPLAVEVMQEAGVDISQQRPREVRSLFQDTFQFVVALYGGAGEKYPIFPFARKSFRWSIPNPELAEGSREAKKDAFRRVRDQVRRRVELLAGGNHGDGDPAVIA